MKNTRSIYLVSFLLLNFLQTTFLYAQKLTQNIKGVVIDSQSEFPLVGTEIVTRVLDQDYWAVTNEKGKYLIENVPVGKINIKAFYIGFNTQTYTQLDLEVGKELVVNFSLLEMVDALDEVVIKTQAKRDNVAFVTTSSYGFNVEQTDKYAGSMADVSRMAMNYAGVNSTDDSRNDIIVRGNNPFSLLWTIEGITIPNPNHYSSSGSSGGPVSMININTLKKSDFLSSAFPANFGNTSSAIFDLQFREGNKDHYEFVGQMGFAGAELGVEGPFSKKTDASFMANYRYSTVAILGKLGLDVGTGEAVPIYQDASLVVNIPTKKSGKIKAWAIVGISEIEFETSDDPDNLYVNLQNTRLNQDNKNLISGIAHKYFFTNKTSSTLSFSHSTVEQKVALDTLGIDTQLYGKFFDENIQTKYTTAQAKIKTKINVKNSLEIGSSFTNYGIDLDIFSKNENYSSSITNNTGLSGSYINWQHRFSDKVILNSGLRYQYFTLNKQGSLEPRLGLKLKANDQTNFNFAYGLHSNIHPLLSYFTRQETNQGVFSYENTNLRFTKSHHFVVGIRTKLLEKFNLKTEVYYQSLFDVPISYKNDTYSIINSGYNSGSGAQVFFDALYNEGKGKNYGIDITLERPLSNGYYILLTGSLYDSKYLAHNEKWYNTAWNGNFMMSFLTGKEFVLNPKSTIGVDMNLNYAGGRRNSPVNIEQSVINEEIVYEESRAYEVQLPHYFRPDLKIRYKRNGNKINQEWQLDLRNLTNTQNVLSQKYDIPTQSIENTYQTGLLPVMQYRILF